METDLPYPDDIDILSETSILNRCKSLDLRRCVGIPAYRDHAKEAPLIGYGNICRSCSRGETLQTSTSEKSSGVHKPFDKRCESSLWNFATVMPPTVLDVFSRGPTVICCKSQLLARWYPR